MAYRTNILYLQHFVAVLDHRSFTVAAKALNVAQPSVTRSIRLLEQRLGHTLFERTTRYVVPTPIGMQFGRTARSVLAELSAGIANIQALGPNHSSSIKIDGSPIVAPRLFPKAISDMADRYPECLVSLNGPFDMRFQKKLQSLINGDLDLIASIANPDHKDENIVKLSLLRPELKIVIRRDHPICISGITGIADLVDTLWILPKKGTEPYNVVENEFVAAGEVVPRNAFHMENWDAALSFVRHANAVCALPYHPACFGALNDNLVLLPIRFRVDPIRIDIYVRSTYQQSPAITNFIEVLKLNVQEAERLTPHWRGGRLAS